MLLHNLYKRYFIEEVINIVSFLSIMFIIIFQIDNYVLCICINMLEICMTEDDINEMEK
jgi:hypothetical protein